jgi:hypothetical protein
MIDAHNMIAALEAGRRRVCAERFWNKAAATGV